MAENEWLKMILSYPEIRTKSPRAGSNKEIQRFNSANPITYARTWTYTLKVSAVILYKMPRLAQFFSLVVFVSCRCLQQTLEGSEFHARSGFPRVCNDECSAESSEDEYRNPEPEWFTAVYDVKARVSCP